MEVSGANIVQMTQQRENAATFLIVPELQMDSIELIFSSIKMRIDFSYLDFEIIATRNEQWLLIVEANATYGAIVFIELL